MMGWVTNDARLKLVSLVLAACTWFFVKGITSDWRLIEGVPLEVKARTGLTVLQTSASTINVVVRGTREDVRQVSRQDLSAVVDLTQDDRVGPILVKLTPKSIRHSRRVQVSEIDPPEVTVNVDQMIEREFPVQAQLVGDLPPGLATERVVTDPPKIRERGPRTLLDGMTAVSTLPIDVTGRRTSFRESVELAPLAFPEGSTQQQWVQVDVRIGPGRSVDSPTERGVEKNP
ncbi:MAG TPA: CdaR family protein [Verrucomicrobiae bacterium]|nr:CdaR family protein [Verrucomicrobiae bacterium]